MIGVVWIFLGFGGIMDIGYVFPHDVKMIIDILNTAGHEAYAVGGCVRDMLMGNIPNDYDITTSATPKEMTEIFKALNYTVIPTGLKHGTVTLLINSKPYEITTFRFDGEYKDHRHPESVNFTRDVKEDLIRRDFTINAMAMGNDKKIIDISSGICDIKNKVIRAVGDPNVRFCEDALRILRAVRFASRLKFSIEDATYYAAKENAHLLKYVSVERKISELSKILLSDNAKTGIDMIFEFELQDYIIEGLKRPTLDVSNAPLSFECRMAALMYPDVYDLSKLKLSNESMHKIKLLLERPNFDKHIDGEFIRCLMHKYKDMAFDVCMLYKRSDIAKLVKEEEKKHPCVEIKDLKVNGKDLMDIGIFGKDIKHTLDFVLKEVIKNPLVNDRDKILELVKEMTSENQTP